MISVTHPEGEYKVRVFDHVTVRVRVEEVHAHAHAFQLELLSINHKTARGKRDDIKFQQSDIVKVSVLTVSGCY